MNRAVVRLGAMLFTCFAAARAEAHDPPFIYDIVWGADGQDDLLLTNRGLIIGKMGKPRQLVCSTAMRVSSTEPVDILMQPDGAWLIGTSGGLLRSSDRGCSFVGVPPLGDKAVYALQRDPHKATRLVAVTGDDKPSLYVSEDSGASWQAIHELPAKTYYEELKFATQKPDLLYAGGVQLDTEAAHFVAISRDGGASFVRHAVPVLETETDSTLLDVNPNGDRVLVKTQAATGEINDRLLLSTDDGHTFTPVLELRALQTARFSSDGTRAYVTGLEGLWISNDAGSTFTLVPDAARMTYAAEHLGKLFAGGWYRGIMEGSDGLGTTALGGGAFDAFMAFTEVTEPAACPADSETTTQCAVLWADWQREFPPATAAGSGGSSGSAGMGAGASGSDSAGGYAAGAPGSAGAAAISGSPAAVGGASASTPPAPALSKEADGGCSTTHDRDGSALGTWALLLLGLAARASRRFVRK